MSITEEIELKLRRLVQTDLISLRDIDAPYARAMTQAHEWVERAIDELCAYNTSPRAKQDKQAARETPEETAARMRSEFKRSNVVVDERPHIINQGASTP